MQTRLTRSTSLNVSLLSIERAAAAAEEADSRLKLPHPDKSKIGKDKIGSHCLKR